MKNNLKKIIAGIMAGIICIGMAGCGDKPPKDINDWTNEDWENAANQLEENYDGGKKNDKKDDKKDEKPAKVKVSKEILKADKYSGMLQLGKNTVIQCPVTLDELIDAGAVFEENPNTTIIEPDRTSSCNFQLDGFEYYVSFWNDTKERQLVKDCICIGVPGSAFGRDIVFPGGVKVGMSGDDLIKAWGEPDYKDIDVYGYYDGYCLRNEDGSKPFSSTGNSYVVNINLETKAVSAITYETNKETGEMIENSRDDSDGYKYTYTIPDYLSDGNYLFECNGESYLFIFNGVSNLRSVKMTEFTDDAIKAALDKLGSSEKDFVYNYKLSDDHAVVCYKYSQNGRFMVYICYIDSDFKMHRISSYIYPCNGTTEISEDAFTALEELMFSIGNTIKPEKQ